MKYDVIVIEMPKTSVEIQDEINNATSDGSKLISIAVDNGKHGHRLVIVTAPS